MSALSARLAKLEAAIVPSARWFTVEQVCIIGPDDTSERLPIEPAEMQSLDFTAPTIHN